MFVIKKILNLFIPSKSIENDYNKVNKILDRNEKCYEQFRDEVDHSDEEDDKEIKTITDCIEKSGIITQITGDRGVINNNLHFYISQTAQALDCDLEVGAKVDYIAYNASSELEEPDFRIRKILRVSDRYFDEPTTEHLEIEAELLENSKPQYFLKHKRKLHGCVSKRNKHNLTVITDEVIVIDSEFISMDFMPLPGDQVIITCYVQTNEQFVDKTGEILEIINIKPARSDTVTNKITEIGDNYGILVGTMGNYYFLFDILNGTSYKPSIDDLVEIECIESNGSYCSPLLAKCNWRCITIKLLEKAIKIITKPRSENDNVLASWTSNKNDIVVADNPRIKFTDLNQKQEFNLDIRNNSNEDYKIISWGFKGKKADSQLQLIHPATDLEINLDVGAVITFVFVAEAKMLGFREEYFELKFNLKNCDMNEIKPPFKIGRKFAVDVGDPADENYHTNVLKFCNNLRLQNRTQSGLIIEKLRKRFVIPGQAPAIPPRFIENRIAQYPIPDILQDAVLKAMNKEDMERNIESIYRNLMQKLSPNNYLSRFAVLLHLEELEYSFQIRQYDRERAHFQPQNEFLRLNIDNLAEKRPSLIIGDFLQAVPLGNSNNSNHGNQGFIHKVLSDHILLKFNIKFHTEYNGEDYRLYFDFSRNGFKKKHHALEVMKKKFDIEFLFPTKISLQPNPQIDVHLNENNDLILNESSKKIVWHNEKLNKIQKLAVKNVLRGEARPMPYIIFGPPGTGKTITTIETILQLFKNCSNSRLLVAAPSNSSADLIAIRLVESGVVCPGDFLRILSHNIVEKDLIPEVLKPYCATIDIAAEFSKKSETIITKSGLILNCQKSQLAASRILIGTCMSLANLLFIKFPQGHFTHAIIDEAGQCLEPEIMTVICQINSLRGQVVLAGDPLQLGPIVLNKYSSKKGLEVSFLSRILSTQPYCKDKVRYPDTIGYNERLVTQLIYNYRSVPSILYASNNLFYDGELIAMVDKDTSNEAKYLKILTVDKLNLREPNFGVGFIGIRGENKQDPDSPSWYNPAEARSIVMFTIKLLQNPNVEPKNIGIIAPYQQQVRKIRLLLEEMGIKKKECMPKIGSVEEFQGQERDIILISTVRSTKTLLYSDLKYSLGFIKSEKRMNVAISRAKSLLLVYGNPMLLQLDPSWKQLIQYCINNNSAYGCENLDFDSSLYSN